MANVLKDSESNVICGIGVYTHTAASSSMYHVATRTDEVPPSGLTITIAQTGSTSVSISSTAPSAAQGAIQLSKIFNCVAGDVLTVIIASSSAIDNQLNTVKTTVAIGRGQS